MGVIKSALIPLVGQGTRLLPATQSQPGDKRYDIGNLPSYFESFVEFAPADPLYGAEFRKILERLPARA